MIGTLKDDRLGTGAGDDIDVHGQLNRMDASSSGQSRKTVSERLGSAEDNIVNDASKLDHPYPGE